MSAMSLTSDVLSHALSLGFDRAAAVPARPPRHAAEFTAWLAAGYHGEMGYLAARAAERLDPARLAPDAASMIVLAVSYRPERVQRGSGHAPDATFGRIARYAWWADYHETLKPKLHALDTFIRERTGRTSLGKAFVDSAPVLERDFAEQAGLGFIGRNTCLIAQGLGSWTFLAGLLVPEVLTGGQGDKETGGQGDRRSGKQGCGRCTRCLDACPTRAFGGPYVLDARRCISYLTIELRGPIPRELRSLMGNWVFGCDVCQEVCPYNRVPAVETAATFAKSTFVDLQEGFVDLRVSGDWALALSDLLTMDEAGFRARFRGTPVMRAKRRGLVRNACVAAGNSGDPALVPALIALLADSEPLVRGHAAWALRLLGGAEAECALVSALAVECDPWVRSELVFEAEMQVPCMTLPRRELDTK